MDCHIFLKHMPSTIFANNNDQEDNSCVCYKEQSHRPSNHMQKCIGFLERVVLYLFQTCILIRSLIL